MPFYTSGKTAPILGENYPERKGDLTGYQKEKIMLFNSCFSQSFQQIYYFRAASIAVQGKLLLDH